MTSDTIEFCAKGVVIIAVVWAGVYAYVCQHRDANLVIMASIDHGFEPWNEEEYGK